jgi:hypothetical protein
MAVLPIPLQQLIHLTLDINESLLSGYRLLIQRQWIASR